MEHMAETIGGNVNAIDDRLQTIEQLAAGLCAAMCVDDDLVQASGKLAEIRRITHRGDPPLQGSLYDIFYEVQGTLIEWDRTRFV